MSDYEVQLQLKKIELELAKANQREDKKEEGGGWFLILLAIFLW